MKKLIVTTMVLALSGLSPVLARGGGHGGGMHGGGMNVGGMNGGGMNVGGMNGGGTRTAMDSSLARPADPTVPPSLTPDARLIGTAPLPPHQQPTQFQAGTLNDNMYKPTPDEAALDKKIGSICKGC
jgi:hypothetical protein